MLEGRSTIADRGTSSEKRIAEVSAQCEAPLSRADQMVNNIGSKNLMSLVPIPCKSPQKKAHMIHIRRTFVELLSTALTAYVRPITLLACTNVSIMPLNPNDPRQRRNCPSFP